MSLLQVYSVLLTGFSLLALLALGLFRFEFTVIIFFTLCIHYYKFYNDYNLNVNKF